MYRYNHCYQFLQTDSNSDKLAEHEVGQWNTELICSVSKYVVINHTIFLIILLIRDLVFPKINLNMKCAMNLTSYRITVHAVWFFSAGTYGGANEHLIRSSLYIFKV